MLQAWRPATLLKKTPTQVFSHQICKNFKSTYLGEHLWATASKHRSSFLEVFCRSCCSALINAVIKYSFSAAVVQSWRVSHGNVLKIAFHHRYFSKNFTTVAEQQYWKLYLDGCFWDKFIFETFLHGYFSKAAADVYSF